MKIKTLVYLNERSEFSVLTRRLAFVCLFLYPSICGYASKSVFYRVTNGTGPPPPTEGRKKLTSRYLFSK